MKKFLILIAMGTGLMVSSASVLSEETPALTNTPEETAGKFSGARNDPPEVVLENEVEIGPDGTVPVVIDTRPAKELHGDQDHQYSITAEVVDESRRTIVGTGNVLVSRQPFKVFAWVDRGHYRAGDTVKASFHAQTLDQKPV